MENATVIPFFVEAASVKRIPGGISISVYGDPASNFAVEMENRNGEFHIQRREVRAVGYDGCHDDFDFEFLGDFPESIVLVGTERIELEIDGKKWCHH